jgi:ADP-ribose pyrophosphatase YjhB (NUDIX family)/predicted transcriptional regulator
MQQAIHELQKEILLKLMQSPKALNFSELLPEELKLESYKFNYHLQYLVKEKLIEKSMHGYKLTEAGLNFISPYTVTGEVSGSHKVSVALVVFRDGANGREILMQKRQRHPFFGDITSIAGKIRLGELIVDAAKRKLKEEAALDGEFRLIGVLRKCKFNKDKVLLEDTFYHYCVTENPSGDLESINKHGENFWVPIEHALFLMKNNADSGKSYEDIFKRIVKNDLSWFYSEQSEIIDQYSKELIK